MRYIENKAFPYPVLSRATDDFVNCSFQPKVHWKHDKPNRVVMLSVHFVLSEYNLIKLLKTNKAKFIVEVNCPKTYTRRIFESSGKGSQTSSHLYEQSDLFEMAERELYGKVTTNCYIVSNKNSSTYNSDNFNDEYNNSSFEIEEGHVLAVYPPEHCYVDTEPEKPIGSFFQFVLSKNLPFGEFQISFEDEKYINFLLNQKTKASVEMMSKQHSKKEMLWGAFYFPAILRVMYEMEKNFEEHGDKSWFAGINKILNKLDPPIDFTIKQNRDLLRATQQLLRNPLGKIIELENDNGEY